MDRYKKYKHNQQRMNNNNNNNNNKIRNGYHHLSTYSTFTHYAATSGTGTGIGTRSGIHSNHSSVSSIHQLPMLRQYGSKQKVLTKIYTIIDDNITIKQLRQSICYKYKIECDRIKWI